MSRDPLLDLIKRRHPRYDEKMAHWNFVEATYEGGRGWFEDNLFRFHKEGDREYKGRLERAYRFNHTKQVVDLVDKYLFKMAIARKEDDAPESLKTFWADATLSGLDIDEFSKMLSSATSKMGRVYVVVDSTVSEDGAPLSLADEKNGSARVYAYIVPPQDMLDMSKDDLGRFNWVLMREHHRDDADPMTSSGNFVPRYRLWTREKWFLFEERRERGRTKIVQIGTGDNKLGEVPVVEADHVYSDEQWVAPGLIDDVAYLDRTVANYLSNLDSIIQDQTFSQLTLPSQGLSGDDKDAEGALVTAGTSRIFTYDAAGGGKPEYISPDAGQAGVILDTIAKIIDEVYHSVGLQAQATGSNSGGAQNSEASGASKAYDFEKINSLLAAKAAALEQAERRINRLVALYSGEDKKVSDDLVVYPIDFDVRGIYDEFEIAARLNLIAAPDEVRREQMRLLMKKLFPAAGKVLQKRLESALKDWPPQIEPGLGDDKQPAAGKKNAADAKAKATQKTAKELAA
jgi:hypothetical protein